MNRTLQAVFLLPLALVAAGCGRVEAKGPQAKVTVNRTWSAAEIKRIRVFEVAGNITIEAVDTSEITLIAEGSGDLDPKQGTENEGLFSTTVEHDTLSIGRRERKHGHVRIPFLFGDDDVEINYRLKVPHSVSLDLQTVSGRIATKGVDGEMEASTVNGPIDVELSGRREFSATTVNGRVRAKFTNEFQGARFKTVNGGVEAILPTTASFRVDLAQVNGDFEASFPLSIHSQPGSRRVSGEVNGGTHRLKIVTVNGDVELSRLGDSL